MPVRIVIIAAFAVVFFPAGFLHVGASLAQPVVDTTTLHLDTLLLAAANDNPALQAARLRAEARATERAQVGALPDPMVGVMYQPYSIVTARGAQRTQWRLEQQIPFPGKRGLRADIATLGAEVASAEADALAQDLALNIKHTYYELNRVQGQERLIRQFQAELEHFEEVALTQYEVGRGAQSAVLKAQIERRRLDIRLEDLAAERQSAVGALARLTGRPELKAPAGRIRVAPPADIVQVGSVAMALEARPEALALRRSMDRADQQIDLAHRAFLPDFTIGVNYFDIQHGALTPTMTGRDALALNIGLKIPLWFGKQRAQLEEARLARRHTETQLDALRLEIQTKLDDLRSRFRHQKRQITLLEETLIPQAEAALEATLSGYTTGQTGFLDLLDAQRTLFQLRMDRQAIYARHLKAMAELERTLGRITLPPAP